jgi:hypothetical protein
LIACESLLTAGPALASAVLGLCSKVQSPVSVGGEVPSSS